ncbi:MAG TPA: pantoate--beta-alanine ligase, partial [Caulobacterales bacterium]|nr:pantoate--beta-alanine ligase [Caulobacterales bacterium]
MEILRTVHDLRRRVQTWRDEHHDVGLVPTMGALHTGHLSLLGLAKTRADRVVTSVFVNPMQFAAHEDLGTYPRDEAGDAAKLEAAGCDLLFAPSAAEMYPQGFATKIIVEGVTAPLEGQARPGHFAGVATIVAKLFQQVQPDVAAFGEKDYQQLLVIRRLVRDLDFPVEILAGPIVREADGLALSSRNAYLSPAERAIAGKLNVILREAVSALESGAKIFETESKTFDA